MRPASSGSWRFFCMPAIIWAAGAPSTFIKSFSRASKFPKSPTVSTNFATTYANSKVTVCSNVTAHDMPTALTSKGFQVALLFLFFHKRLCGPLANSRFHHQPDTDHRPKSKLEAAYYKADRAIQDIVNLLDAA